MDISSLKQKIPRWVREYRYPLLIALFGLLLLLFSGHTQSQQTSKTTQSAAASTQSAQADVSEQLAQILAKIDGVGKVRVMLTVAVGETTHYHSDEQIETGDTTSSVRKETVIITDSDRNQRPLITQVIPAQYQGAVIVCQGADDARVKWAVVEAVTKATGLGANQISVLKMK